MDTRYNHRDLTPAQKAAFVNAVLALKNDVDSVLHPEPKSATTTLSRSIRMP